MSSDVPPVARASRPQPTAQAHGEPSEARSPQETERLAGAARRRKLLDLAVCLGLILSALAVYAQVGGFDFVNYDDNLYVYQNAHVRAGLTPGSVKWALTSAVVGNWTPVTMLSHLLDVQLFGMSSGMHHLVNVVFHTLSAVLLFLLLRRATGGLAISAFVAFVFALHPLHVESVAWVSERKDVLSGFFWFLALYGYVRYTERPSSGRFLLVEAPFCLGLMSKPMIVTFPFTLLLLDIWPLRRTQWPKTVSEKLPLIALCAGASAIAYFVQKSAGAVTAIPLATRTVNVFISYVTYIGQTLWPTRLACYYPYPQSIRAWPAAAACAVLLAVSALAAWAWRMRPYLAVGWFWFLGTLVPVIGLVQVGTQAHADRYMYIPMVGLLLMLAWGAADLVKKWPRTKPAIAAAAVVSCAACMALAWKQASYWQNSETLFQHAIEVTQDNWVAEFDLGTYLNTMGRGADAIPHFETALRIKPDDARVQDGLGASLASLGDCTAAVPHFEAALRARPGLAKASYNLGYCLAISGDDAAAIPLFEAAIRAQPGFADAHFRLGMSLSKIPGRAPDAIREYEAVLRLTPDDAKAHVRLGELLASVGRTQEAIAHLEAAQRIHFNPAISKILSGLREGQR
jgi:protein O-mannosyl-transferase